MAKAAWFCYFTITYFTLVSPQSTVDQELLDSIFGTPPTTASLPPSNNQRLEDITVRPTDSTSVFENESGQACKCLPYYLCDDNKIAVDENNVTVTGWGTLDVRFGEDKCQESVEHCCLKPKVINVDTTTDAPEKYNIKGCGYRNPKGVDFTITGGSGAESQYGEFPWVVALMDAANDSYAGVGVLIHPNVVITGAHIAAKFGPSQLKIRAGEWDTQTSKERLPHQERVVKEIYLHSDYHPKTLYNDIALLRVDQPVDLAEHINVICLPEQDMSFDKSEDCIANGWGKDVFGLPGRYAVILKRVEQDMVPNPRCNSLLKRTRLGPRFNLHETFVCAGGEEGKDTCQGDGGAPLACPIGNDRYKLAGLVAWGIGCGQKDVPGVYTRVAMFRQWVDNKMAKWEYDMSGYKEN